MTDRPSSDDMIRRDFALAHRVIAYEGMHEGTWNHLSVTVPSEPKQIYVTPGNRHFSGIHPDDILTMDEKGNLVGGHGQPNSSAWCLHYPMHEARPDAKCIIHLHPLKSTAMMMQAGNRLNERANQMAASHYTEIAYYETYDGLLQEADEGRRMAEVLGDKSVLVLRNHGIMIVGETIGIAVERAYTFDRACHLQLLADSSGRALSEIPDNLIAAIHEDEKEYLGDYFEGMRKQFDEQGL